MIAGILQVRTGATRLPFKVLKEIKGKTLIELYIERVKCSMLMDKVIIATTTNPNDDIIEELAAKIGVDCFRGSENDLIDRYYQCAKQFNVDVIVRLCNDDPFVDYEVIDEAIETLTISGADWVTNHLNPTYPEGLDIDVFHFKILKYIWKNAKLKSEREHVFPYVYNNMDEFKVVSMEQEVDRSGLRWTLDYEEDFKMTEKVYEYLYDEKRIFLQDDILELLLIHPEIKDINSDIEHYEGIKKSFKED